MKKNVHETFIPHRQFIHSPCVFCRLFVCFEGGLERCISRTLCTTRVRCAWFHCYVLRANPSPFYFIGSNQEREFMQELLRLYEISNVKDSSVLKLIPNKRFFANAHHFRLHSAATARSYIAPELDAFCHKNQWILISYTYDQEGWPTLYLVPRARGKKRNLPSFL